MSSSSAMAVRDSRARLGTRVGRGLTLKLVFAYVEGGRWVDDIRDEVVDHFSRWSPVMGRGVEIQEFMRWNLTRLLA